MSGSRRLFPSRVGNRFNEVERLERGILRLNDAADDLPHYCDEDITCSSVTHLESCPAALDPLRRRNSVRAYRVA